MKKLIDTLVIVKTVALKLMVVAISGLLLCGVTGCCKDQVTGKMQVCITANNYCPMRQAFGNAIRSLEGTPLAHDATKIPGALQTLADTWLPKTGAFADLARQVIDSFVKANPITPEQVDAVLEKIAMQVQGAC